MDKKKTISRSSKVSKTTKTNKTTKTKLTTWGWIWRLFVSLAIPLAVGGISALISGDLMSKFGEFNQPPLAPPAWLFPVAWTILYILMGIACFLVWIRPADKQITMSAKRFFFVVYGIQLVFNFFWSIFFFNLTWHLFAFFWLLVMWIMIIALVVWGFKNRRAVAWVLMPYLLWTTFAAYLNIMIAILN